MQILGTLLAALIGAALSPYLKIFLDNKKIKKEKMIKYLAKAYLEANKINSYVKNYGNQISYAIAATENNINPLEVAKFFSYSPLNNLVFLLDFHLHAPIELIDAIKIFQNKINSDSSSAVNVMFDETRQAVRRERVAGFNKSEKYFQEAKDMSTKIIKWIKNEKHKASQGLFS